MRYALELKQERLAITSAAIAGGRLVLRTESRRELAAVRLAGSQVEGDELVLVTPLETRAAIRGRVSSAEIYRADGRLAIEDLKIGGELRLEQDSLVEGQTVRLLDARIRHG